MPFKNVLIYNEDSGERGLLADFLRSDDIEVFEASRALQAIHIVRTSRIDLILIPKILEGDELAEFVEIARGQNPRVKVLHASNCSPVTDTITLTYGEARAFVLDSLGEEFRHKKQVDEYKDFLFSFTERLLQLFEVNNKYFFNNDKLVAELSVNIARRMKLDASTIEAIRFASLLKDIGKVGIQNKLFEDKSRFSSSEMVPIKTHTINSVQIFRDIRFPWQIEEIIVQHHENYDGSGYPDGLVGVGICVGARIIHIADSFVAMTTDRPYRKALDINAATEDILQKAGTHYDPVIVEEFISVLKAHPKLDAQKHSVLVLERQPTLTSLIRLSVNAMTTNVMHSTSSFDAVRLVRKSPPDLVIADVEMLDKRNFETFIRTLHGIPAMKDRPFIFILPSDDYPRSFKGTKVDYLVRPVDMAELMATIMLTLSGEAKEETEEEEPQDKQPSPKGISGSLSDFSITDIVQILNLSKKTAKVELRDNGNVGVLYFNQGNVVHASMADDKGNTAFYKITRWNTGTFQVLHEQTTDDVNINIGTNHLILESARLADEQNKMRSMN